jgi:hypothetical protein
MLRLFALIFFCVLLRIPAKGQNSWQHFEASDGSYSLAFPDIPEHRMDTIFYSEGIIFNHHFLFFSKTDSVAYHLLDTHYSSLEGSWENTDLDSMLELTLEQIAKKVSGQVIFRDRIEFPAYGLTARIQKHTQSIIRLRIYLFSNRMIIQQVQGKARAVNAFNVKRFFESLTISL